MAPGLDEAVGDLQLGLFHEARDLVAAGGGRQVVAALDVAVAGLRPARLDAEHHEAALARGGLSCGDRLGEHADVGHVVVGGKDQHHRVGIGLRQLVSDHGDGRRGAAAARLEIERTQRASGRLHLVLHQEAMVEARDDGRGLDAAHARQPLERGLEGALIAEQRKELLGIALARHGPQARAAAPGEDDGMEVHVSRRYRGA